MPHYEIHHSCTLTQRQYQTVASQITQLHCTLFSAPSAFVNVTFHRHSNFHPELNYNKLHNSNTQFISVGGRPVWTNYIIGHLRPRGPSAAPKLRTLVQEITRIWDEEARYIDGEFKQGQFSLTPRRDPSFKVEEARREARKKASGRLDDARGLHNVFVMEDIVAGAEQGFLLPVAGEEGSWVEENMGAFEKRAREGDESMRRLVEEVRAGLGRKE